jgi:hypothetical protein
MWFNKNDILKYQVNNIDINIDNLHGYVLPHAGTKHTGHILSHTLRFKPTKSFTNILIIYLPVHSKPNVENYYHEYYVPYKALKLFYPNKKFIGYNTNSNHTSDPNINTNISKLTKENTLFIISADFSHFLSINNAIKKENCAAHSLILNSLFQPCTSIVDNINSFKKMYELLPDIILQWIGRTRSVGSNGVGYLSFLLRDKPDLKKIKPDGFFVSAYDKNMRQRECLGNTTNWNTRLEKKLISNVLDLAKNTSRLTNGKYLKIPITNYSVIYLYKDKSKEFIRGWHSILMNGFYLSDVFLENTYDNGTWFNKDDKVWKSGNIFDLEPTKKMLIKKSKRLGGYTNQKKYQLYTSQSKLVNIEHSKRQTKRQSTKK